MPSAVNWSGCAPPCGDERYFDTAGEQAGDRAGALSTGVVAIEHQDRPVEIGREQIGLRP